MSSGQNEWAFEWDCDCTNKDTGDLDWTLIAQLLFNSKWILKHLLRFELPSNGKHVIAINLILMAVSDKKNDFLKMKPSPIKKHCRRSAGC